MCICFAILDRGIWWILKKIAERVRFFDIWMHRRQMTKGIERGVWGSTSWSALYSFGPLSDRLRRVLQAFLLNKTKTKAKWLSSFLGPLSPHEKLQLHEWQYFLQKDKFWIKWKWQCLWRKSGGWRRACFLAEPGGHSEVQRYRLIEWSWDAGKMWVFTMSHHC